MSGTPVQVKTRNSKTGNRLRRKKRKNNDTEEKRCPFS